MTDAPVAQGIEHRFPMVIETSHNTGMLFIGSRCCLSLYCEPDFHKIRVAGRGNHHMDGFLGAL